VHSGIYDKSANICADILIHKILDGNLKGGDHFKYVHGSIWEDNITIEFRELWSGDVAWIHPAQGSDSGGLF
jgi:hypothetical protein